GSYTASSISRWAARLFGNGTNSRPRGASPKGARWVEYRCAAICHPKVLPGRLGCGVRGPGPSCPGPCHSLGVVGGAELGQDVGHVLFDRSSATTSFWATRWSTLPAASSRSTSNPQQVSGSATPGSPAAAPPVAPRRLWAAGCTRWLLVASDSDLSLARQLHPSCVAVPAVACTARSRRAGRAHRPRLPKAPASPVLRPGRRPAPGPPGTKPWLPPRHPATRRTTAPVHPPSA